MKVQIKILGLILLFLISCRERNNMFDVGSDGFIPPPPIDNTWVSALYYDPSSGYLIGVQIQIDFAEAFEKDLVISHEFYQDISIRTEFNADITTGTTSYAVEIYGPYEVGGYRLKIYFGGMPIGSCPFSIVGETGRLIVEGISRYETTSHTSDEWHYSISF